MKKLIAILMASLFLLSLAACAGKEGKTDTASDVKGEGVMTYAEYAAAALDTEVVVETYVQAKEGGYFIYEMACTEEEFAKLTPGTKIKVTGFKSEWAGEVEIIDAKYEIEDGNYVASAADVTDKLGTDALADYQNRFVSFKGMTVEAYDDSGAAFAYKNDVDKTDDLYFKASKNGTTFNFCIEFYLTGADTAVYKAVEALKVGDVIDMEGFLYWYEGANPHITSVTPAQ